MKEIKFRAWDKNAKIMIHFNSLKDFGCWLHEWSRPERYILLQYTDLKDKNKKEICEGDIIKSTLNETKIGIMEFKKGRFQISFKNRSMLFCHENRKSLEVLGNIYENPELLEEK